jgi:hypothetical protein
MWRNKGNELLLCQFLKKKLVKDNECNKNYKGNYITIPSVHTYFTLLSIIGIFFRRIGLNNEDVV